jgi:prepilin-type processing-associated H-X9-DG protein
MRKFLRSALGRILVPLSIPLLLAAIAFPYFAHARENARRASCQSNLKQLALGIKQYQQDYESCFPLTHVHSAELVRHKRKGASDYSVPFGWADSIQPYVKSVCILNCPSEISNSSNLSDNTLPGFTDYWLNENLSGKAAETLGSPQSVILQGDGEGSVESTSQYSKRDFSTAEVVAGHLDGYSEGPWFERHLGGANYSFADGHVKWLLKNEVSTTPNTPYTFAPN